MTPSIESLQALWCKHTNDQFRTWHMAAMQAAWEAGRDATLAEGVECWVVWNLTRDRVVGVQRAIDTYADRADADHVCDRLNIEVPGRIYEVRPARLVVMP